MYGTVVDRVRSFAYVAVVSVNDACSFKGVLRLMLGWRVRRPSLRMT